MRQSDSFYKTIVKNMISAYAYHRIVLDSSNEPIDYEFIDVNAAFEKLTGLSRDLILGRKILELIPELKNEHFNWIKFYGKVALSGESDSVEQYVDSLKKWFNVTVFSPEKGYFISIFNEITDLKIKETSLKSQKEELGQLYEELTASEEELRQQNDEIQAALEFSRLSQDRMKRAQLLSHTGNWEIDMATGNVWGSEEAFRLYGLPRITEFLPLVEIQQMVHPDDRENLDKALNLLLLEDKKYDEKFRLIRANDGCLRIMRSVADLIKDEKGMPQKILGVIQDISELVEVNSELKQSNSILQATLDSTTDGILVVNKKREKLIYNKQFLDMWSLSVEDLNGREGFEFLEFLSKQLLNPDQDIKRVNEIYSKPDTVSKDIVNFKNGKIFECYSQPLEVDNEIIGRIWSFNDITERKLAEEERKKINKKLEIRVAKRTEQLETAYKEIESFSYSVSHDLRAPLRSLDGFSQLLLSDYSHCLDEQGKHYIERISTSSRKMGQLIDDLLNLSRLSRSELLFERVNLSDLVQSILNQFSEDSFDRKVNFKIAQNVIALCDKRLIQAALQNLLDNAWKFTGMKQHASIEFGLFNQEQTWIYYIKDDGAGFDMAYSDKLFNPFQRLHRVNEFSGNGIGLATVQRIIHRHGGKIWAESALGKGATFFFTIS